jgi:hypothetical protein
MPDKVFEREPHRFNVNGLECNRPVDSCKEQKWPILVNVRAYKHGRLGTRPGLTEIGTPVAGQSPLHSVRRLNDPQNSTWTRIIGTGTHLAYGQAAFTDADSGYSGDPLALVPWRPEQSPDSWMYVADSARMRKIAVAGTLHRIGLPLPTVPPVPSLTAVPKYKAIDSMQYADSAAVQVAWIEGGTAGNPTLIAARVGTTIAAILYDSGATGWASVKPTALTDIGPGTFLLVNSGGGTEETVVVQSTHYGSAATTVAAVLYDSGVSGACSIVLTNAIELEPGTLIYSSTHTEYIRVGSVHKAQDGAISIRTSTAATFAATDAMQAVPTIRAYFANAHIATEALAAKGATSAVTKGTGTLTRTVALDLSVIAAGIPAQADDYIHIGLSLDHPELLSEGKVMFDVDIATNDFTKNFYYRAFRAADMTPAAQSTQTSLTTQQLVIQRDQLDEYSRQAEIMPEPEPTPVSEQLTPGTSIWTELRFKVSDLTRVGSDRSRSLANVAAVRISLTTTGTVALGFDDIWIGGGYGPDTGSIGASYLYRYRARCKSTGVRSNPCVSRASVSPDRQGVLVTMTQYTAATEADVLDVERFGGVLSDWHYVGTTANSATPTFTDTLPDATVSRNPDLGMDNWQPWPVIDIPHSGTTGIVSGTTVADTATNFNLLWAPGTEIKINGIDYVITRVLSTSKLEIEESAGSQSAVTWEIAEPILLGQPLPCLWGHINGMFLACGDPINPGRLYYSMGNDPDSTNEVSYIDVTSPSEPLQNGCMYNGRAYLFSTERLWEVLPTGAQEGDKIGVREIPNGKGLFSRWALTRNPGPMIQFLSKNGIWTTDGGSPRSLTEADLSPLFPHEGSLGQTVNTLNPPDVSVANVASLRLAYYDDYLYFDYVQTGTR